MGDSPDINFIYADSDSYENEIAELYSYSEGTEFQFNIKAFENVCSDASVMALWQSMSPEKRFSLVTRICDQMEHCNPEIRTNASRALLYIVQGCWGEAQSDQEQGNWVRHNCFILLQCNAWASCMQLLNMELESWASTDAAVSTNAGNASGSNNKQSQQQCSRVSLSSSTQLRILLSILYTMVETLRWPSANDTPSQVNAREAFCAELAVPQEATEELLAVTLLGMVTRFCNSSPPHFPIRKLLLLLWKTLLVTLGGSDTLRELKVEYRTKHGLPTQPDEDTVTVCRGLRPASPPALVTDLIEQTQHNMVRRRPFRRSLMKQSSLDDSMGDLDLTGDDDSNNSNGNNQSNNDDNDAPAAASSSSPSDTESSDSGVANMDGSEEDKSDEMERPGSPRPPTPSAPLTPVPPPSHSKGLPWTPKVRQKDIDCFLDVSRDKFVGFQLSGDSSTLAGLPPPIHEGVHTLSKHIYTSLSELQMKREEEICRNPLSRPEGEVPQTPAEILYQSLLSTLPQSTIALLKVLLAAAPTSKAKTDSINIMADVLPEEMPLTVVQSMKLGLDVNRHKEVLVKAVSASLLLLLKHFKLNHIYQFEFMSQHLVFANCIPLILKFFNQSIMAYVQAKNTIALLDFPSCVIGDGADLSNDALLASIGAATAGVNQDAPEVKAVDSNNSLNTSVIENGSSSSTISSSAATDTSSTPSPANNNNSAAGDTNGGGSSVCCWRNMFSCVNLLRVLNKLCKWKHSRIMMLVVFKSAPILKRTLMVKHALMQLYVLKLLKMQTKYLGRQWRKSNMKTLSAIYQMVRHRLNDDWAYGNDPDARPWDFQTEECSLRAAVDRFNTRRYHQTKPIDANLVPVDNCITSVLGRKVELTDEFTRSYEVWLQREVLNTTIHWDLLLSTRTAASETKGSSGGSSGSAVATKGVRCTVCCSEWCECMVTVGGVAGSGAYTPLIDQLSGYTIDDDVGNHPQQTETVAGEGAQHMADETDGDHPEYSKQTMIKRNPSSNGAAAVVAPTVLNINLNEEDAPSTV